MKAGKIRREALFFLALGFKNHGFAAANEFTAADFPDLDNVAAHLAPVDFSDIFNPGHCSSFAAQAKLTDVLILAAHAKPPSSVVQAQYSAAGSQYSAF